MPMLLRQDAVVPTVVAGAREGGVWDMSVTRFVHGIDGLFDGLGCINCGGRPEVLEAEDSKSWRGVRKVMALCRPCWEESRKSSIVNCKDTWLYISPSGPIGGGVGPPPSPHNAYTVTCPHCRAPIPMERAGAPACGGEGS